MFIMITDIRTVKTQADLRMRTGQAIIQIDPKYSDILVPYHTCPKIRTTPFPYLSMCLKWLDQW